MKQVWKRRAVVAAVLMLVGTSVYLNWRYAGTVEDSGKKVLGQSALVNGETTDAEVTAAGDDYFATARHSRKQARDTAISMAKGYADCVAFMGDDAISVVVSDPDGLDAVDVARIKDIVVSETSYTPDQIRIMEAGATAQTGNPQEAEVPTAAAEETQAEDAK